MRSRRGRGRESFEGRCSVTNIGRDRVLGPQRGQIIIVCGEEVVGRGTRFCLLCRGCGVCPPLATVEKVGIVDAASRQGRQRRDVGYEAGLDVLEMRANGIFCMVISMSRLVERHSFDHANVGDVRCRGGRRISRRAPLTLGSSRIAKGSLFGGVIGDSVGSSRARFRVGRRRLLGPVAVRHGEGRKLLK